MEYRTRVVDAVLDEMLDELPAVAIEGAKGVGKTATAGRRARTVLTLSDPRSRASVTANYDLITQVPAPVLIDEWQLEPTVWERVRAAVDEDPASGARFLLAGSAGIPAGVRLHSGAGRIVRLVLRPMALCERGLEAGPSISLAALHDGGVTVTGTCSLTLADYVDEILRSGLPGIRTLSERNRARQLDGYISRIIEHDLPDNGVTIRRPAALRAWLRAYAAATASTASYSNIRDAATAGQAEKPARTTVDLYREHLTRLFILDPLDSWAPTFTPLKNLVGAPKHHLVDPALAARIVGVGKQGLLQGDGDQVSPTTATWLGALFESLAVQSVRVYADAIGAQVGHLRTKRGEHEVDIVVETPDTRATAFEVKLADTIQDRDVRHLVWLRDRLGERLVEAAVLYAGPYAYRRPDGVAVIPLALLAP